MKSQVLSTVLKLCFCLVVKEALNWPSRLSAVWYNRKPVLADGGDGSFLGGASIVAEIGCGGRMLAGNRAQAASAGEVLCMTDGIGPEMLSFSGLTMDVSPIYNNHIIPDSPGHTP